MHDEKQTQYAEPEWPPWLANCTLAILELNHLVDQDLHRGVSYEDATSHIKDGDVFDWLREKFAGKIDLSLLRAMPDGEAAIVEELQSLLHCCDPRRKFGVEHNGICLLVAFINQMVQQRVGKMIDLARRQTRAGSPSQDQGEWPN